MTEITRDSLQRRYTDLVDAELLRRIHSGVLTELAHEVATAEAQARGLSLEKPETVPERIPIDDIDFAPDEFERNPYQAPRVAASSPSREPQRERYGIWDVLWFIYTGIFGLLVILAAIIDPRPTSARTLVEAAMQVWGLTGIVAWRLRRAWLLPFAWVACLAVNLAWHAVQLQDALTVFADYETSDLLMLYAAGITITAALPLPMFWGLARYSLLSRSIWRTRQTNAAEEVA